MSREENPINKFLRENDIPKYGTGAYVVWLATFDMPAAREHFNMLMAEARERRRLQEEAAKK